MGRTCFVVKLESQMKSSDGGLPVSGVQLGAVSASVYKDRNGMIFC